LKRIEKIKTAREKVPGSFEPPLSSESKRVLAFAADEADRSSSKSISTEHVLLGLREEECLATKTLPEGDVELASTGEELRRVPHTNSALTPWVTRSRISPIET
jgi:ATP-dependent Clp protease ATP-binding subunit ClpC